MHGSDLLHLTSPARTEEMIGRIINQDFHDVCRFLPPAFAGLVVDSSIQGYSEGVFWERNSLADQKLQKGRTTSMNEQMGLFYE